MKKIIFVFSLLLSSQCAFGMEKNDGDWLSFLSILCFPTQENNTTALETIKMKISSITAKGSRDTIPVTYKDINNISYFETTDRKQYTAFLRGSKSIIAQYFTGGPFAGQYDCRYIIPIEGAAVDMQIENDVFLYLTVLHEAGKKKQ